MNHLVDDSRANVTWFVGAAYGGADDQTSRFLADGIWENGYEDKYLDLVRSMRPGERIAIKSAYVRKHGLPFDNRGQAVSVMAIKAIGTITENLHDGKRVHVTWTKVDPIREWYFYTQRWTVWRVMPDDWYSENLISFAFDGKPQDVERFRRDPYWRDRFGPIPSDKQRFKWTAFYEAIADKLLQFRNKRAELVNGVRQISSRVDGLSYLAEDRYTDGSTGFVKDICPFTTMGMFNRGISDSNRKAILAELTKLLGIQEPFPASFEGIPILNNMKSKFFPWESRRDVDHIDALWSVFATAIKFADADGNDDARSEFATAFDNAIRRRGVAWNLTMGLYWIRPWSFPSLDSNSRIYIGKKLGVPIGLHGPKKLCSSTDYLAVMDVLDPRFQEASYPVHSYPELSLQAWLYKDPTEGSAEGEDSEPEGDEDDSPSDDVPLPAPIVPYAVEGILNDGCFLERAEVERLLHLLRTKKNVILQGPPGTGKTWIARRLAFALMGQKDESKVRVVQFHPNLSYEDFVRGWRPTGDGKLSLVDGVFMETVKAASKESSSKFVVVIEEINRGNPAQILGEMLTLLEAGKRTPSDAVELCYPDADGKRRPVHVPENLYVIGTMNIADRSLALVDLALRRRFAFVTLEPKFNSAWRDWVVGECGVDPALVEEIERRMTKLNEQIADDLGNQFRIGHSFATPATRLEGDNTKDWFRQVAETEIRPLLEEYWFDSPKRAKEAADSLTQGW